MKQSRLDSLADGIFAIVMTLLVFEIRVPDLPTSATDANLVYALLDLAPLFLSYLLSFSLLFTYWRSHHFIASIYAKNIDIQFTNINAVFFLFVGLVPFSAHFLGSYSTYPVAVIVFALNVIMIGLSLFEMRNYAHRADDIANPRVSKVENRHAHYRILFPVFCAIIAIGISFFSIKLALSLFTIGILFNLSKRSTTLIDKFLGIK